MSTHHHIVIVGGGNAGISVAAQLLIKDRSLDIAIIDPSDKHYYQPAWTLVGSGAFQIQDTERSESSVIPKGAKWIQEAVATFDPANNSLSTQNGSTITYDYLVVAPGIQLDWGAVKGLKEALGHDGVSSNYSFQTAPYTFEMIKNLKKGKAIFHNPHTPVKCGGAPHKIMYMAADYWRKNGNLNDIDIQYWSGAGKLFAVPKYEKTLLSVAERGHVGLNFMQRLEEMDGPNKKAKFVAMGGDNQGEVTWVDYDIIHVTPPQSAPDFIKNSPLANAGGWVDVDKHSLQHPKFSNVYTLGDASGLPTSKTGAAIRKQAPVLVENLLAARSGAAMKGHYIGYTSCPLVTGYGKLVLIDAHYSTRRLPRDYAELLYVSPNHLNALTQQVLGRSAGDLIRERVVLEAKRMLINSDRYVSEIAQLLRFEDNSYFVRFFKKHTGVTPEEFRKSKK